MVYLGILDRSASQHYNKGTWITLVWTCTAGGKNIIPKNIIHEFEKKTRPRGRPRNR
jgi:hypothetical protein